MSYPSTNPMWTMLPRKAASSGSQSGFRTFAVIVLLLAVVFSVYVYHGHVDKRKTPEQYSSSPAPVPDPRPVPRTGTPAPLPPASSSAPVSANMTLQRRDPAQFVQPSVYSSDGRTDVFASTAMPCPPQQQQLDVQDLLPKEDPASADWNQFHDVGEGAFKDVNLLVANKHFGIDTVGGKKSGNYQIRSEPPNPRYENISPWLNSTMSGSDFFRKPLE